MTRIFDEWEKNGSHMARIYMETPCRFLIIFILYIHFHSFLSGYVFWTLLSQIAFWHVAQIILAIILLLGSFRVSF